MISAVSWVPCGSPPSGPEHVARPLFEALPCRIKQIHLLNGCPHALRTARSWLVRVVTIPEMSLASALSLASSNTSHQQTRARYGFKPVATTAVGQKPVACQKCGRRCVYIVLKRDIGIAKLRMISYICLQNISTLYAAVVGVHAPDLQPGCWHTSTTRILAEAYSMADQFHTACTRQHLYTTRYLCNTSSQLT